MFYIRMADMTIRIENRYGYVQRLCRDYILPSEGKEDLVVSVTDEEIQAEMAISQFPTSPDYAEGVCLYRKICKQLPLTFQAFLFHCAVIEFEGKGYAFAAKSGTGKSTHIALWQKRFGEAVHVINGDKPILRFLGDSLYAYGTPWCGKEGLQMNASVPLQAICFLERAPQNTIRRIGADEAVMRIFHQILSPDDVETLDALVPLLDRTLREVPCYVLGCNISEEAAEVAYRGMKNKSIGE